MKPVTRNFSRGPCKIHIDNCLEQESFGTPDLQSWKKCVGTLESIFPLYCATGARNLNADIYTFLYMEFRPL